MSDDKRDDRPEFVGGNAQLIEWAKAALEQIAALMGEGEDFSPILLMSLPGQIPSVVDVSSYFADEMAKSLLTAGLTAFFRRTRPTSAALVTMAWCVTMPKEVKMDSARRVIPSLHPGRREVVQVIAYDGSEVVCESCLVTRGRERAVALGPWERMKWVAGGRDALKVAFDAACPVRSAQREAAHQN